ncbi:spirocyclase AveC family protein [Streptomyces spectabilis]|uniref:spirocyclase AveC family protein n=1 Tax=Streptomyces spectabilis TaxID=68270 RepID=UPI0033EC79AA
MSDRSGPRPAVPHEAASPTPSQRSPWLCASVVWALIGAVGVGLQVWVFVRWAADGNLHAYPSGGYTIPTALKVATRVTEGVLLGALALGIWWCRRHCRAAGRVTLPAALLAGCCLSFWLDGYLNAADHTIGHNRYGLNVLSWGPYLPGWTGPQAGVETEIESLLTLGAYAALILWIFMGVAVAARLRRWRPHWSRARIAAGTAAACLALDIPMEQAYQRVGGYGYVYALPRLTLFEGHYYQLPLSSPVSMILLVVMPVVLMTLYARPGRDIWIFEGSLRLPRRAQGCVRLLAGVGYMTVAVTAALLFITAAALAIGHPVDFPSWFSPPAT